MLMDKCTVRAYSQDKSCDLRAFCLREQAYFSAVLRRRISRKALIPETISTRYPLKSRLRI